MDLIPIVKNGDFGTVYLDLRIGRESLMPQGVPFLVDTGATRTFLSPGFSNAIRRKYPNVIVAKAPPIKTLVGDLDMWHARIDLYATTCQAMFNGADPILMNQKHWICVAGEGGLVTTGSGQKLKIVCQHNLLGWDILEGWGVYYAGSTQRGFLYRPVEPLHNLLRISRKLGNKCPKLGTACPQLRVQCPELDDYFKHLSPEPPQRHKPG